MRTSYCHVWPEAKSLPPNEIASVSIAGMKCQSLPSVGRGSRVPLCASIASTDVGYQPTASRYTSAAEATSSIRDLETSALARST